MFLIHGKRTAQIKKVSKHDIRCPNCKSFDFEAKVFRRYYHLYYIPFAAFGEKLVELRCRNCGTPLRSEPIQKEIASEVKTPLHLFAIPLFFACLVVFILAVNQRTQKQKAAWVASPKIGDVYLIRKEVANKASYSFLRLSRIAGDTVYAYHNLFQYPKFTLRLDEEDCFVQRNEMMFTRKTLKEMLDRDEINAVERDYDGAEGFNKIR